jgi:CheY-like chemotaxis protein
MDKKRIMVVDDDTTITRLLKLNLEQTNDYDVKVENASTAALASAQHFRPDLILLDVMMPGLDGGDLAHCFQTSPQLNQVPIVFFTAAVKKQELATRGGRVGGLPFLAKPADVSQVIACINEHLGKPAPPA